MPLGAIICVDKTRRLAYISNGYTLAVRITRFCSRTCSQRRTAKCRVRLTEQHKRHDEAPTRALLTQRSKEDNAAQ